jgi:HK97 family phage prohead protease
MTTSSSGSDIEYLTTSGPVECRRGNSRIVGGYALSFNTLSADLGGFVETVEPQFCEATRSQNWAGVTCRFNHDRSLVLGSVDNGTLRCAVDGNGLDYSVDVPEWPGPPYVYEMISRGDISSSSFTFRLPADGSGDTWVHRNGVTLRRLLTGQVLEVSPVDRPAYPSGTSVALRSLAAHMDAPYEDVAALAESRSLAKLFVRSDRPAPAKISRSAVVDMLAQDYPEVRYVGKSGAAALAETMAASPAAGAARSRQRLLDTMAEHPAAVAARVTPWEARRQLTEMATPPVYSPVEVSVDEYLAISEAEASRARMAEAESRSSAEVTRPPEPPRRTLTGAEALRILDGLRPSLPYETAESRGLDENY